MRLQAEPIFRPRFGGPYFRPPGKAPPIYKAPCRPVLGAVCVGHFRGLFYTAYSIGTALFSFGKKATFYSIGKVFIPPKIEALVGLVLAVQRGYI